MAARGRDDDKGFLARWSQRKREADEAAARGAVPPEGDDQAPSDAAGPAAEDAGSIDPRDLPDIDSLDAGSDFTVFMRSGIPPALKQRALRKLWQVDPAFSQICMLDDYNLDYTDAATVVPNLKTLYQVGRGMVLPGGDAEETADTVPAPEKPALQAAPPPAGDAAAAEAEEAGGDDDSAAAAPATAEEGDPAAPPPAAGPPQAAQRSDEATPQDSPGFPAAPSATRSARRRRWGDSDA